MGKLWAIKCFIKDFALKRGKNDFLKTGFLLLEKQRWCLISCLNAEIVTVSQLHTCYVFPSVWANSFNICVFCCISFFIYLIKNGKIAATTESGLSCLKAVEFLCLFFAFFDVWCILEVAYTVLATPTITVCMQNYHLFYSMCFYFNVNLRFFIKIFLQIKLIQILIICLYQLSIEHSS